MRRGRRRLFGHIRHEVISVYREDPALLQLLFGRLEISHNTGGVFLPEIRDEPTEAEIEQVVARDNEQVTVKTQPFKCKSDIAHGTEPRFVRFCPVVNDSDAVRFTFSPLLKKADKFMI